jgi:hypothetical protein
MKTVDLIKGLQILLPYYGDQSGYHAGAEHDVLYAYPTNDPLTDEDVEKMIALGWYQEHDDRDYSEDFSLSDYRQDESWCCYT